MKRILFIDDEPSVLDGIRNILRRERRRWAMSFAVGGEAGIREIERNAYDVIVSDMKMPGVDGAAVLTAARAKQPEAIRIVLSGYCDVQAALRAVPVAHQMLGKPIRHESLREVIDRSCGLRELIASDTLARTLGTIDALPSVPEVYIELEELLMDPEVGSREIARVVSRDLALSARLLQIVNSSYFSSGRPLATVNDAIVRLGTKMIKSMVLGLQLFECPDPPRARSFSMQKLQAHGFGVAQLARRITPASSDAEAAFLAGLLHDAGELIFAMKLPDMFDEVVEHARRMQMPRSVAERELLGASHGEIGAYLLGIWGLPYPVVEAIAHHHHPSTVDTSDFGILGAVHVAATLFDQSDAAPDDHQPELDDAFLERTGTIQDVDRWRAEAA